MTKGAKTIPETFTFRETKNTKKYVSWYYVLLCFV